MENASKALIIAGAILLSILIIAIGMYIYTSSQNTINEAGSQISATEIQAFNQTWEMYEGPQSGSNVRTLISKLASNATTNAEEETRLPDLYCEWGGTATNKKSTVKSVVGNTKITEFNAVRTKIQQRHIYRVTLGLDANTGLVNKVVITYDSNTVIDPAANTYNIQ